jgi:hypothetical protein
MPCVDDHGLEFPSPVLRHSLLNSCKNTLITTKLGKTDAQQRRDAAYRRFDDVVRSDAAPRNSCGIFFTIDNDGFACNPEFAVLGFYGALESAVDGVVLEHVDLVWFIF